MKLKAFDKKAQTVDVNMRWNKIHESFSKPLVDILAF
ncbi:Protein of unknown function [Bacillus thuringiensis]|uniref:Uncharacterized protein n=1 Tax=Bacillus thuringiensis TaxID=1428 RepID=A0A1C3ZZW9_BACTU|nr:Protein of unknown function [Bacillus thuringiensis]